MKFILFVEGHTEDKVLPPFLKRWLDKKLPQPVGIKTVRFEGWAELKREVRKRTHLYFESREAADIIAVISIIDLYGPTFYPDHLTTMKERYDWAKKEIEEEVNHQRFRQFFAVHETEAWLLSQPELFPTQIHSGFQNRINEPETINFNEPPAKLLERLYRDRLRQNYKKLVHGKSLFDRLDVDIAYNKCPKLKELLDEMLRLAEDVV